ncbi:acetyl-CoA carboxylase [Opitutaceae bacterium TAV5]|nr:acetyl-CoA carboxylase [Opitutaceae bacterium TAV5]
MKYIATVGDQTLNIKIDGDRLLVDGEPVTADLQTSLDGTLFSLLVNGRSYALRLQPMEDCYRVQVRGETHDVRIVDERTHRLAGLRGPAGSQTGEVSLRAPMPGVIVDVLVKEGQTVEKGQTLVVLESMKMHNEFMAPRAGTVSSVRVAKDQQIEKNSLMLILS